MAFSYFQIQRQYKGFYETPFLWQGKGVFDLAPYTAVYEPSPVRFSDTIDAKLRLGKFVERFVSFELNQRSDTQILAENLQIQQEKITLGELDCLLLQNHLPIHLEVVYKFYLYDPTVGSHELEHWIGPNRKDSLIEKLNKLKNKQLPLLHHPVCQQQLRAAAIAYPNWQQQVYFKAQLFIPLQAHKAPSFHLLNADCIQGYYAGISELANWKKSKFYLPVKHDWLQQPHTDVAWNSYEQFYRSCSEQLADSYAPLWWVKQPNGELLKLFVVWW